LKLVILVFTEAVEVRPETVAQVVKMEVVVLKVKVKSARTEGRKTAAARRRLSIIVERVRR
jgi:hypothetical protein